MRITHGFFVLCFLLFLIVQLQPASAADQQDAMQHALDMMKAQGMDAESLKQVEGMLKNVAAQGEQIEAAKTKKEREEFDRANAGHGTARVTVEGKLHELTVTRCEISNRSSGEFVLHARQPPGMDKGQLWVNGEGAGSIQFSVAGGGLYEGTGTQAYQMNDSSLEWQGPMSTDRGTKAQLSLSAVCGSEMKDYSLASKPNPRSDVNSLTFELGDESFAFHAGHCSTEKYRNGNLIVLAEVTATGSFRGRPAIILLSKSHPVDSTSHFEHLDLLLGELSDEQQTMAPIELSQTMRDTTGKIERVETAAAMEKYTEQINALQKEFGDPIPPDRVEEWSKAFAQLSEVQNKEMDRIRELIKSMSYAKARSNGPITINGQDLHFAGTKLRTNNILHAPEFRELDAEPELWVTCGN